MRPYALLTIFEEIALIMADNPRRRGLACERCRSRKQKCLPGDGGRCKNCDKADAECQWLEKTMREEYLERWVSLHVPNSQGLIRSGGP